jgi:hypothetical protein
MDSDNKFLNVRLNRRGLQDRGRFSAQQDLFKIHSNFQINNKIRIQQGLDSPE